MSISNITSQSVGELLQLISEREVAFATPQHEFINNALDDLPSAMGFALENPVEYPPLSQSVFPGDSIAIAIQPGLTNCKTLLLTLIERLLESSIEPTDVNVVVTAETAKSLDIERDDSNPDTKLQLQVPDCFHSVQFHIHNPEIENGVAYLAANEDGEPMMVNRVLFDSDVVLPIGQQSAAQTSEVAILIDCIYPAFSNSETIERYRIRKGSLKARNGEIRMVNDHLGTFFAIQVVAGPGNTTQRIFSGVRNLIVQDAQDATNEVWSLDPVDDAQMAIATIETESNAQSWHDFSLALIAANRIAVSDGPLLIWSEISEPPGRSIRKACETQFESGSTTKLSRELQEVAGILAERGVYLRSKLPRATIESLGIGFVSEAKETARMIAGVESGVLLRDAHQCIVRVNLDD